MNFIEYSQLILTGFILIILAVSSKEDLRYHRISKKYVMLILIFTLLYTLVYPTYGIERTTAFVTAFIIFGGVTFISRGMFGFGDSIIIAAIALYIGKVHELGYFFLLLATISLIWGAYCILKTHWQISYRKAGLFTTIKNSFNIIDTVPIDKVVPGMILSTDYFMEGLKETEIIDLKKKGYKTLRIKQAYPYIPVIFISFLLYLAIIQYHLLNLLPSLT